MGDKAGTGIARPAVVDVGLDHFDVCIQHGARALIILRPRRHGHWLELADSVGDGGIITAGGGQIVPNFGAAWPHHPGTFVRRPFGGHGISGLAGGLVDHGRTFGFKFLSPSAGYLHPQGMHLQ